MDYSKLQDLLDSEYEWPANYQFKFVGNESHREDLTNAVGVAPHKERPSSSGKYISFTFVVEIKASHEVISIYKKVSQISGIISL
jgi:putative lipoic acid-binding regulatory protein